MDYIYKLLPLSSVIGPELHGQRLDAALSAILPDLGLRGRRRLWEHARVLLDGRASRPGDTVRSGQFLEVLSSGNIIGVGGDGGKGGADGRGLRILKAEDGYIFFFKPSGLASAAVAASPLPSAEGIIRSEWENLRRKHETIALPAKPPLLCNRLDNATSGLLVASENLSGLNRFRTWETEGLARKFYLALVCGRLEREMLLDQRLDMKDRSRTRVLPDADADPLRHTRVRPLAVYADLPGQEGEFTLLEVLIQRGARHQIRAHLAGAGYSIAGDAIYGKGKDGMRLFLHHFRIVLPGAGAEAEAEWPEWGHLRRFVPEGYLF